MPDQNPTDPKGPGSNQPIDPGVSNVFERMARTLEDQNASLDKSEKLLKAMAEHAGAVAEEAERASAKLSDQFRLVNKIEDKYKQLQGYAKKRSEQGMKEFQEAKKARKELEAMAGLYEGALKNAKESSKEHKLMSDNLGKIRKLMKDMPRDGELTKTQLQGVADAFERASLNAKDLVKSMESLSRTGATLKGMAGIFGAMGIGKGVSAKIDRRMAQAEELKQAIADSRELRQAATRTHMMQKRARSIAEMQEMAGKGGLARDPDTGEVTGLFDEGGGLTKGGRDVLARKMGFSPGSKKYGDFVAGEAAGGEAATGAEAAGWASSMSEGGGAIEGLATVFETGMEGITTILEGIAPELVLLVAAISFLADLFSTYTKQNQEMEKQIGAGGLFTQPGVGAGAAFMNARNALLPGGGQGAGQLLGAGLGINWERNLALAGALTQAGMAVAPSITGGGNAANLGPGAMGEFMHGGVGEIQRIVMGAGRVGGLTDQEGIEQTIKLLDQYRETMASSEQFMTQINKDTQAAGISTTKYLKIIDEVSSAFDRMSKSLDQVTGVMRELSRYGAVSSESLKDMMDFLSQGQAKTDVGNLATAAFTQQMMPKDILEGVRDAQQQTLSNYVDEYNSEATKHGMPKLNVADIQAKIKTGDFAGAQGLADSMMGQIDKVTDPTLKKPMLDALTKVQDQINRVSGVMSPDFLKRASAQGLYGMNEADKLGALLANIRGSTAFAGMSVTDLLSGKGSAEQQIMLQQLTQQLGITGTPAQINMALRRMGQNRVSDLSNTSILGETRAADAKAMMNELYKGSKAKGGWRVFLEEKGLGKYIKAGAKSQDEAVDSIMSTDDGIKKLQEVFGENLEYIAGSKETQDRLLKSTADGHKQGADAIADQISQARGIAMRTQSVGDLLKNTFQPLLIKLIHGVEEIATVVSKWFGDSGGDSDLAAKTEQQQVDEMSQVGKAIDTLSKNLDASQAKLRDFEKAHTDASGKMSDADKAVAQSMAEQSALGADTLAKLEEINQTGAFTSGAQESLVMDAIKKINAGGMPPLQGAGFANFTQNNYYSSDSTMNVAQPATPGTSPGESAPAVKTPAATKPVGMTSLDNR